MPAFEGLAKLDPKLFGDRIAIVSTPSQRRLGRIEQACDALGERAGTVFDEAAVHTPTSLRDRAERELRGASGLVALGGGAAIGLSKALAVALGLPYAAVPTTYSGSEMTPLYGVAEAGQKQVRRDARAQARVVLYDPSLALSLPAPVRRTSLINCLAHSLEVAWLSDASPLGLVVAAESCRSIAGCMGDVDRDAIDGRVASELMLGAWLGGVALAISGTGLQHSLAHVIGGVTGASHAAIHTVVLPVVARLNARATGPAQQELTAALSPAANGADGAGRAARSIVSLLELIYRRWELPQSLPDITDVRVSPGAVAERVLEEPAAARNLRSIDVEELRTMLSEIC